MSEALSLFAPAAAAEGEASSAAGRPRRRRSFGVRVALVWEVVTGGLRELWAHKLR